MNELKSRFTESHRVHSFSSFILPCVAISNEDWKKYVCEFAKEYKSDLPEFVNLESELDQWKLYWNQKFLEETIPDTITDTLLSVDKVKHWFPNIYRILCLVAVVPASSNSCERSMSRLRTLKTYLRSSMSQERLSSLALAGIHREIELDPEKILDRFAINNPRRMELIDILDD